MLYRITCLHEQGSEEALREKATEESFASFLRRILNININFVKEVCPIAKK